MRKAPWRWPLAGLRRITFVAMVLMVGLLACSKKHNIVGPGPSPTPTPTPTPTPSPGTELMLQLVSDQFDFPIYLTAPPGDFSRLFVCQKGGLILIVKNGVLLGTPFLDLTALVSVGGEQGLLCMAFDPNYASNGRFYVSYTDPLGDSKVARYQVSALNPDIANPAGSAVLSNDHPDSQANHNGGMIAFGPDGMLYLSLGDGGGSGDPFNTGQDRTDLLGSIVRVDVSGNGVATIPTDNPYFGHLTFRGEIWSYGLRNPWRFSFDRTTGDLYIGDVGQGLWEEVEVATSSSGRGKGANYGWSVMEGSHCFNPDPGCDPTGKVLPIVEYDHSVNCSVTGGYVYRGGAVPALQGTYFYADYCTGTVYSFRYAGGQATEQKTWPSLHDPDYYVSFGEDARGELYLLGQSGKVWRLAAPAPPP